MKLQALTLAFILACTTNGAWAQSQSFERFTQQVDLPNLPVYSGKTRFVEGFQRKYSKGGISYMLTYAVGDSPDKVLRWYQDALRPAGWENIKVNKHSITATRKGNHCSIQTNSNFEKGEPCLLRLGYFSRPF